MAEGSDQAIALFAEVLAIDQLARSRIARVLPKGMELSHFVVLNHLAHIQGERTPAELARAFHVTRGAMTNTLNRLDVSGYIHIRPDWDDARRKLVAISPAGVRARSAALDALGPVFVDVLGQLGSERVRQLLPALRELRQALVDAP